MIRFVVAIMSLTGGFLFNAFNNSGNNTNNMRPRADSSRTTVVEYRITPVNNFLVGVLYTGADGSLDNLEELTEFGNGTRKVIMKGKPFSISLTTITINNSSNPVNYSISIIVNGEMKKIQTCVAPAFTGAIAYTVHYDL